MTTLAHYDVYTAPETEDIHGSPTWTQLNASGVGAASAFTRKVDWMPNGGIEAPSDTTPVGLRSGARLTATSVYGDHPGGVLRVTSVYGGADTGADLRAEMQDEHATLVGSVLSMMDGERLLRFDRPNRSATTLSRMLICRVKNAPPWKAWSDRADTPTITLDFDVEVLYAYFITRTATSTAYAGVGTSFSSATIANGGDTDDLGLVVKITAKTGSPTLVTLENTTTGLQLLWTIATTATVNDRLSWFGDDPRYYKLTTTNASHLGTSAANADPSLIRGNNTIKLKVNSGTIDATVYTAPEFLAL